MTTIPNKSGSNLLHTVCTNVLHVHTCLFAPLHVQPPHMRRRRKSHFSHLRCAVFVFYSHEYECTVHLTKLKLKKHYESVQFCNATFCVCAVTSFFDFSQLQLASM